MRNTIFTFILIILVSVSLAEVPHMINYNGRLTNSPSGTPVTGIVSMTFTIYDADIGGDSKWTETHPTVSVVDGLFNIILGAGTPPVPIEDTVFSGTDRWLEITVGAGTIVPRTKLVSTPYAFRVSTIDGASGGTISGKLTIGPGHTNTGDYAFVAGSNNTASGERSTVGGGGSNTADGSHSAVGGGWANTASGLEATISGGFGNTASGSYSTIPGGSACNASGNHSFAAGRRAKAMHDGSFVWADSTFTNFESTGDNQFLIRASGGVGIGTNSPATELDVNGAVTASTYYGDGSNLTGVTASSDGDWTINNDVLYTSGAWGIARAGNVLYGYDASTHVNLGEACTTGTNGFSRDNATVSGGYLNSAGGDFASIGGGHTNAANGSYSTISGGAGNITVGSYATVSGGVINVVTGSHSTVGGGISNSVSGNHSIIGGGENNSAGGQTSTVSGGGNNQATGSYSTIPGGYDCVASGAYSFAAGLRAKAIHYGSFVWADANNVDFASTVDNQFLIRASGGVGIGTTSPAAELDVNGNIKVSDKATIGPGHTNTGIFSFVAGHSNTAAGNYSTAGGGAANIASADQTTVGGGGGNTASDLGATVGGGEYSTASGHHSTVGGGRENIAGGNYSTVAGGIANTASGNYSTIPGGRWSLASGSFSFAAGSRAKAVHNGAFVWADQTNVDFSSTAEDQFLIRASGGVGIGTDNPSEALHVVGNICYTGSIGACSDIRYKKDIKQVDAALETITQLRGVTYNWKTHQFPDKKFDDQTHLGFIAQEIKGLLPSVVMTNNDGYMSVDYGRLTPVLVEAVKELKAENDDLKAQLTHLTSLVETILAQQKPSNGELAVNK